MNILFLDDDKELTYLFQHLDTIDEINIFFCESEQKSINTYGNYHIDIVIINFTLDFGQKILDYILQNNPKQKVITISDVLECSEKNGCLYCQSNYNKIRLLKPINTSELVKYIKSFKHSDCKYYDNFDTNTGLVNIMEDVIRRFSGATYNKETKTISMSYPNKIIDIIQFLDTKGISFDILHNNSIQLKH
jgi:response regulator RpfG family c-di-GMP phosphodiesterase